MEVREHEKGRCSWGLLFKITFDEWSMEWFCTMSMPLGRCKWHLGIVCWMQKLRQRKQLQPKRFGKDMLMFLSIMLHVFHIARLFSCFSWCRYRFKTQILVTTETTVSKAQMWLRFHQFFVGYYSLTTTPIHFSTSTMKILGRIHRQTYQSLLEHLNLGMKMYTDTGNMIVPLTAMYASLK